ncbi:MAG: KEOPS complex subunit Pcc1 [Candidatus Aenigmarchaeota archaeon]|nr:KEOPS complex subunit Pcc1 [Candidatus Aenigmarchaeota archaeon]
MHEVRLRFECKNPAAAKKALEPDIKNDAEATTALSVEKGTLVITLRSGKLSLLKAIINSYISIVSMLGETAEIK